MISLAILGLIATFTVPKVLRGTSYQSANARAKEMAAAWHEAYMNQSRSTGKSYLEITAAEVLPSLNYLAESTSSNEGTTGITGNWTCHQASGGGVQICITLPGGGCAQFLNDVDPMSHGANWRLIGIFDPDSNGPLQRVAFYMQDNGRLVSQGTKTFTVAHGDFDTADPDWFSWQ